MTVNLELSTLPVRHVVEQNSQQREVTSELTQQTNRLPETTIRARFNTTTPKTTEMKLYRLQAKPLVENAS